MITRHTTASRTDLPQEWQWSSYVFQMNDEFSPEWLDVDWLSGMFALPQLF